MPCAQSRRAYPGWVPTLDEARTVMCAELRSQDSLATSHSAVSGPRTQVRDADHTVRGRPSTRRRFPNEGPAPLSSIWVGRRTVVPVLSYSKDMSPLIAQIAPAIWSHAVRVFGTEEKATRWMATRLRQLGERTPEEVLTLSPQSPEIEALLGRIEYVVYS